MVLGQWEGVFPGLSSLFLCFAADSCPHLYYYFLYERGKKGSGGGTRSRSGKKQD